MHSWAVRKKAKEGIYRDQIVLRIPFGIRKELKQLAEKKGLSISDLVRLSIEKYLHEEQPTNR